MKSKFQRMIVFYAILIALIPLLFSYGIFLYDKLTSINTTIKASLKDSAFNISQTPFIQEKLHNHEYDFTIQDHVMTYVHNLDNVDIVVVADMTARKYSHLDISQIGQTFVNPDDAQVLEEGVGYYSLMRGSQGLTYRRFEPIFYNGEQVGFVMVGKYYDSIHLITNRVKILYSTLLALSIIFTIFFSLTFSKKIKKKILNKEPEEIAKLYIEKEVIFNSISNGIIALNHEDEIVEVNNVCNELFDPFSKDIILLRLNPYIKDHKEIKMKEMIILNKRLFVNSNPIFENNKYLGTVITLIDKNEINQIAKEITGVDQLIKTLRAKVHEFKNKLHVILGLIQLNEYEETKKYIIEMQGNDDDTSEKFKMIDDYYVKAMLISYELISREKHIFFNITEDSFLYQNHNLISSNDLITVIGNLIENAYESFNHNINQEKKVEISLKENEELIIIEVEDNGTPIPPKIRDQIFERGVSSKGENRGTGLHLIKTRVELYNGKIHIETNKHQKKFIITLGKGEII
ncbi:Spo0B domain-containing protein [Mycoplasmatota bacterium]|nr:Spo0B domain-containing protein [Mycoplasmatota bacterium]